MTSSREAMSGYLYLPVFAVLLTGLSATRRTPLIIGGREAQVGGWPWQGSLQVMDSHICGCVLISNKWALTAAHCIHLGSEFYSVIFGQHDRFDVSVGKPTWYKVLTVITHPGSRSDGLTNDMALLEFETNVEYNEHVKAIQLAPKNANYDGRWCWTTGWGITTASGSGSLASRLMEAEVPIVDLTTCRKHWENVDQSHLCAGIKGGRAACYGDNGGPLVCNVTGQYEVAGITSFGIIGCDPDRPSLYSKVAYFRDWIYSIAKI